MDDTRTYAYLLTELQFTYFDAEEVLLVTDACRQRHFVRSRKDLYVQYCLCMEGQIRSTLIARTADRKVPLSELISIASRKSHLTLSPTKRRVTDETVSEDRCWHELSTPALGRSRVCLSPQHIGILKW